MLVLGGNSDLNIIWIACFYLFNDMMLQLYSNLDFVDEMTDILS